MNSTITDPVRIALSAMTILMERALLAMNTMETAFIIITTMFIRERGWREEASLYVYDIAVGKRCL